MKNEHRDNNAVFDLSFQLILHRSNNPVKMASPPKCVTNTFDSKSGVKSTRKAILRLVDRFNRKYTKWNDYNAGRRCYQSRQGWECDLLASCNSRFIWSRLLLMIRLDVMYLDTKYTGESSTQVYFITRFYRKIVWVQSQGVEWRKIFVVILHQKQLLAMIFFFLSKIK